MLLRNFSPHIVKIQQNRLLLRCICGVLVIPRNKYATRFIVVTFLTRPAFVAVHLYLIER